MKFAINYSPQAAELVQAGAIEIDLFKCPDWPEVVSVAQPVKPVYIHFPIKIGQGVLADVDFAAIETWLNTTDTVHINSHLVATQDYVGAEATVDDVIDSIVREVETLTRHFGADRVTVENIPYRPSSQHHPHTVDPHLIQAVVKATGCGFLFDVSHAVLTCENTAHDFESYVAALPLHRLRELHITGIETVDDRRTDHMPLHAEDWQRIEWVVGQIRAGYWPEPHVMAFEYGGITDKFDWRSDSHVIAQQVPRLYELAHSTLPVR